MEGRESNDFVRPKGGAEAFRELTDAKKRPIFDEFYSVLENC